MSKSAEEFSIALGQAMKAYRLEKGYSQEELAFRSGLDRTYISLLERGKRNPTLYICHQVAKCLDSPLHRIIQYAEDLMSEQPN